MIGETNQLKQRHVRGPDANSAESPAVTSPTTTVDKALPPSKARRFGFLFTTPNAIILLFGSLVGYIFIPILLVETTNLINISEPSFEQRASSHRSLRMLTENNLEFETRMKHLVEDKLLLSRQSLPTDRAPIVMETSRLSDHRRKKILVTGGAGFVGSHLVDKLMMEGHEVTVVDNLFTGQKKNVAHWFHHPNFK
jgi:hypothetical protein